MIVETVKGSADLVVPVHNLCIEVGEMLTEAHR